MSSVLQTTFSNDFLEWQVFCCLFFRFKFHWSLFMRAQLTIIQHRFRWWLVAEQATSHYLNHCIPNLPTHVYCTKGRWVNKTILWCDVMQCIDILEGGNGLEMLYGYTLLLLCFIQGTELNWSTKGYSYNVWHKWLNTYCTKTDNILLLRIEKSMKSFVRRQSNIKPVISNAIAQIIYSNSMCHNNIGTL